MSQYYKLESSIYVDYGLTKVPDLNGQSVFLGKIIDVNLLPELRFEVNFPSDTSIPHFLTGGSVLASKQLIAALVAAGITNFQAFPALVVNPATQTKWDDFFLFNTLGILRAASMHDSDYDVLMEEDSEGVDVPLVAFRDIVVDAVKVKDSSLFRLAEDLGALIIDQQVVDVLKHHRPHNGWGIDLVKVETK